MESDKVPYVPRELIEHLNNLYRDVYPDVNKSEKQIWMGFGSIEVVRYLNRLYDEQVSSALEA